VDRNSLERRKLNNFLQSMALLGGMAALLALLGWVLGGVDGVIWTVAIGVALLAFSPRVSPAVLLRMYGAQPIERGRAPDLYRLLAELARRAELPELPRLYYLPSTMLNAFTMGRREDCAVVVSDGLLRSLSPRELAGVLAHELSHVANNDMWVMGLADVVSRVTGLLSLAGQIMILLSLPAMILGQVSISLAPLLILVFSPTLSALLQLALSRAREHDADLEAARLTGDPRGLASALAKLERVQGGWLERVVLPGRRVPDPSMLRTHPPTEERVRRLLELETGREPPLQPPSLDAVQAVPRRAGGRRGRPPRWHVTGLWH